MASTLDGDMLFSATTWDTHEPRGVDRRGRYHLYGTRITFGWTMTVFSLAFILRRNKGEPPKIELFRLPCEHSYH